MYGDRRGSRAKRKRLRYSVSLSAMAVLSAVQPAGLTTAYGAAAAQTFEGGAKGIISEAVNFRQEPNTNSPILHVLPAGMTVDLIQRNGENWYQVRVNGQTGWVFGDYVKLKTSDPAFRIDPYPKDPNFYEVRDGKLYHVLGTPESRIAAFLVGSAPAFMKPGAVYVRDANYQLYRRDPDGDKKLDVYVPPYVSLDLRLQAPITAADIDRFIRSNRPDSPLVGKGQLFINAQAKYGVNALYLAAHAIHESAFGTSQIARDKNNLFGYMAYDSDPYGSAAYFASIEDCIEYEAYFVATQYLSPNGRWYGNSSTLKGMNVHYATDPYWAEKIAGIMERIRAYQPVDYGNSRILAVTAPKPRGPVPEPIDTTLAQTFPAGTLGVTSEEVNFRSKPSTSAEKYGTLAAGTQLTLLGKGKGNWYQVRLNDRVGWVYADYVKKVEPSVPAVPSSRSGLLPGNSSGLPPISVILDGVKQTYDQPPVQINDRTLVPLRGIFEKLGAKVDWEESTQTVTVKKGSTTLTLKVGAKTALKDGKPIELEAEPMILNGRTLVPIRFVSEALGAKVDWDETARSVYIYSKS